MNEQKNNGRGIFYGVIGVATLVVAIIGATFAYFTATASNNTTITGNMATVTFGLEVKKVTTADEKKGGMIPMSNTMVEAALNGTDADADNPKICVDDNGNAVCQVYKISITNGGTASMFLDGYVSLTGGSGVPTDAGSSATNKTTMRWAQAFCTGTDNTLTSCTTAGKTTTGATGTGTGFADNWATIDVPETTVNETSGYNNAAIKTTGVTATGVISGNNYDIINTNYIRISDHDATLGYTRTADVTSALVLNQFIAPSVGSTITDSTDSSESYADAQVYYIVVWLSETGTNQTVNNPEGTNTAENVATTADNFFHGNVTFASAQGSEVTATFTGYAQVQSDVAG